MALRAPGGAQRPGDAIAADQLAAANLRGGDVDIVIGGLRRVHAQERGAVAEQLHDALGRALLAIRLLLLAGWTLAPRAATSASAGALAPGRAVSSARTLLARGTATTTTAAAVVVLAVIGPIVCGWALLRARLLIGVSVWLFGRRAARAASANARAPTRFVRGGVLLIVGLSPTRGAAAAVGRSSRRTPGGGSAEDRVNQVGLAQPAITFEAELVGDRVQIGQRAGLELGAVEYGHVITLLPRVWGRLGGWRPVALQSSDRHPL